MIPTIRKKISRAAKMIDLLSLISMNVIFLVLINYIVIIGTIINYFIYLMQHTKYKGLAAYKVWWLLY
jgi:hypothetical protein